jgi:molybdenum cofactor cytidylyltransferase
MGRAKQLLPYRGSTLLRHAATTALASRCRPAVVVVGAESDAMRAALAGVPVRIVDNPMWEKGMGTSIRTGMGALEPDSLVPGVLIMLCDQPAVTAMLLNRLIDEFERMDSTIIASAYDGVAGVPAIFDRRLFGELLCLEDAQGARQLFERYGDSLRTIPFAEGAMDVDTLQDYGRLA